MNPPNKRLPSRVHCIKCILFQTLTPDHQELLKQQTLPSSEKDIVLSLVPVNITPISYFQVSLLFSIQNDNDPEQWLRMF